MTLILATHDQVWGDRRITADTGEKCDPIRKVVSNEWLCAGFAGDFETILESIRIVESGEKDPKVIAKTGVEGLILKEGRLYLLDCRKVWKRPAREAFYACGTGSATALAFLSGRLSVKPKSILTDKDIDKAFKYVARCRTDCSATYDTVLR